jgi:hypothetical protein
MSYCELMQLPTIRYHIRPSLATQARRLMGRKSCFEIFTAAVCIAQECDMIVTSVPNTGKEENVVPTRNSQHLERSILFIKTCLIIDVFLSRALHTMVDTYADYSSGPDSPTGSPRPRNGLLPPSESDIFRYRYHHGVNLGSCFVLERWLTPSMYLQGADSSELAAVTAAISHGGAVQAQKTWEAHWATYLSDDDFEWLANIAHCSTLYLAIWTTRTDCNA